LKDGKLPTTFKDRIGALLDEVGRLEKQETEKLVPAWNTLQQGLAAALKEKKDELIKSA
jgi:hypothetical protein